MGSPCAEGLKVIGQEIRKLTNYNCADSQPDTVLHTSAMIMMYNDLPEVQGNGTR